MEYLNLSGTITAPEPGTEPQQEGCYVYQQQDTEDTFPCSGDQALLNELLRLMGFDIPVKEQPEEYSTRIKVKPKNGYTNLNISFSNNVNLTRKWDESENSQTLSISNSDFIESVNGGYLDLGSKLNLVETDKIRYASWIGTVYDAELNPILNKPSTIGITEDFHLPLPYPVNAELKITITETSEVFDLKITPRAGETENAYQTSMIVKTEGCESKPTRYEVNVPECYRNAWLDKYGWPGDGEGEGDTVTIDPPPEFVEQLDIEKEWCLCGNHKLQAVYPKSAEPEDISNICFGGPCDQINEPDCVPNDRAEGDEYC